MGLVFQIPDFAMVSGFANVVKQIGNNEIESDIKMDDLGFDECNYYIFPIMFDDNMKPWKRVYRSLSNQEISDLKESGLGNAKDLKYIGKFCIAVISTAHRIATLDDLRPKSA